MANKWISKNGSNAWSGNDDQNPYATVAYANSQMNSGDTLWVLDDVPTNGVTDWNTAGFRPPNGTSRANTTKYRGVPVSMGGSSIAGFKGDATWTALTNRIVHLPNGAAYLEFMDVLMDGKANVVSGVTKGANDAFHCGDSTSHHLYWTRVRTIDTTGHGIQQAKANNLECVDCIFERASARTATPASPSGSNGSYGIYISRGPILMYRCQFIDCQQAAINPHWNSGAAFSGVTLNGCLMKGCGFGYTHNWGSGTETRGNGNAIFCWNSQFSGGIFRNNIFWNNRRVFNIGGGTDGHLIYNNSFYLTTENGVLIQSGCDNIQVRNNILLGIGTTPISNSGSNNVITPNLTSGDPAAIWVNHAAGDFRLLESASTARGQAVNLSGTFTDDYEGKTRSAWDHGAIEYAAALAGSVHRKHFVFSSPALAGFRS